MMTIEDKLLMLDDMVTRLDATHEKEFMCDMYEEFSIYSSDLKWYSSEYATKDMYMNFRELHILIKKQGIHDYDSKYEFYMVLAMKNKDGTRPLNTKEYNKRKIMLLEELIVELKNKK